jgi:outer membrane lipoprotein-sorting protein
MRKAAHLSICVVVVLFFMAAAASDAAPTKADAKEIVKKMDELYRSQSSTVTVEMEIITPHWKRTLKMKIWSIGMDKTFIRILLPKKEKGIATLRIENEMWNFLPKTNKVMKIPPSMMMASWMGSDFTNDDLVKEYTFLDDYSFDFTEVEDSQEGVVYVKCVPGEGLPIVWGHIITAVREKDYIPLWAKYYDEKGKLMREIQYKDVKTLGKRMIPAVMELVPTHKEGHKTVVRYLEAEFDISVDKNVFTLRNLRSRI